MFRINIFEIVNNFWFFFISISEKSQILLNNLAQQDITPYAPLAEIQVTVKNSSRFHIFAQYSYCFFLFFFFLASGRINIGHGHVRHDKNDEWWKIVKRYNAQMDMRKFIKHYMACYGNCHLMWQSGKSVVINTHTQVYYAYSTELVTNITM